MTQGPSKKFHEKKKIKGIFFFKVVHLAPKRRQKKIFFEKKIFRKKNSEKTTPVSVEFWFEGDPYNTVS